MMTLYFSSSWLYRRINKQSYMSLNVVSGYFEDDLNFFNIYIKMKIPTQVLRESM